MTPSIVQHIVVEFMEKGAFAITWFPNRIPCSGVYKRAANEHHRLGIYRCSLPESPSAHSWVVGIKANYLRKDFYHVLMDMWVGSKYFFSIEL